MLFSVTLHKHIPAQRSMVARVPHHLAVQEQKQISMSSMRVQSRQISRTPFTVLVAVRQLWAPGQTPTSHTWSSLTIFSGCQLPLSRIQSPSPTATTKVPFPSTTLITSATFSPNSVLEVSPSSSRQVTPASGQPAPTPPAKPSQLHSLQVVPG